MRFSSLLSLAVGVASVNAQYYPQGWKPGQPWSTDATAEPPVVTQEASKPKSKGPLTLFNEIFDLKNILKSGPSQQLFSAFGINITEKLASADEANKIWDERIIMITDENYNEVIVNEPLSPEEEESRVWFIIVSVSATRQNGVSMFMDEHFNTAYNESIVEGDLPDVRWGRIDYLNVTGITTKWNVWQAPVLVVLKDRGQTLRFFKPQQLPVKSEYLRSFLQHEGWRHSEPWKSDFGPGGSKEYILEYLAIVLTKVYNFTSQVPRWMMYMISGGIGSVILNMLHKSPAPTAARPATARAEEPSSTKKTDATTTAETTAASPSKRGNAKQRKGGKK